MKPAIHYDAEDIKKMLAEKHGVEVKNVIRNQYSYTVVLEKVLSCQERNTGNGILTIQSFGQKTT